MKKRKRQKYIVINRYSFDLSRQLKSPRSNCPDYDTQPTQNVPHVSFLARRDERRELCNAIIERVAVVICRGAAIQVHFVRKLLLRINWLQCIIPTGTDCSFAHTFVHR